MPKTVSFHTGDWIEYRYDASGAKLSSRQYNASTRVTTTRDYVGNKVYDNQVLKTVLTEGGYVEKSGNAYSYFFYLKDHQGNNRMEVNSAKAVVQAQNYYAFGLPMWEGTMYLSAQPYKFNGKELDRLSGVDLYDYGARYYDAAFARFTAMDPLAEKYYSISPYAYCANNPVKYVDPTGKVLTDYRNEEGEILYKTEDGLSNIVIIPDAKVKEFENKLNELHKKNKIDDTNTNEQELHRMGTQIEDLKDQVMAGDPSLDAGILRGYDEGYNDKKVSTLIKILRFIAGAEEENSKMNAGHVRGESTGKEDREQGKINKLNPYSSLKNNDPLLTIPKQETAKKYPGVGLPPM